MVVNKRKISGLFFFLILFVGISCNGEDDKVSKESILLKNQVDSLQNLLNKFEVVTDLNNHNFKINVGEQYVVESMAVLKNGLKLDSVFISNSDGVQKGKLAVEIDQGFFGPVIKFTPAEKGTYNIEAYVSSFAWRDAKKVKTQWKLIVDD